MRFILENELFLNFFWELFLQGLKVSNNLNSFSSVIKQFDFDWQNPWFKAWDFITFFLWLEHFYRTVVFLTYTQIPESVSQFNLHLAIWNLPLHEITMHKKHIILSWFFKLYLVISSLILMNNKEKSLILFGEAKIEVQKFRHQNHQCVY